MTNARNWSKRFDAEFAKSWACRDCGKVDSGYYVQPQIPADGGAPTEALCSKCIDAINATIRANHKAALAAMPRCQVDGCKARGTFHVGNSGERALMCSRHLNKAKKAHNRTMASAGGMGLFLPVELTKDGAIALANK